jgi:hypothetical protein
MIVTLLHCPGPLPAPTLRDGERVGFCGDPAAAIVP